MVSKQSIAPKHKMTSTFTPRIISANRRLRDISIEEQETESASGNQVSTLDFSTTQSHDKLSQAVVTPSSWEDVSDCSTIDIDTETEVASPAELIRNDSLIMQTGSKSRTKWFTYPQKGYKTTTQYFYEEIDDHWTAALIVICFFVSGIVDSVSYQVFSVFTSLQTGNTIFMALRLSNQPASRHPFAYIKSITSVGSYCLGGLFFNILHRAPTELSNPRPRLHRWTLVTSFIVQSSLLVISAALAQSGWISTQPFRSGTFSSGSSRNPERNDNYLDLIPIAFLAFEAAGQVCLSRVLIINELPTIVISTLYHDFIGDALSWRKLWKDSKSTRDFIEGQKRQIRRLLCIVALFSGAIIGGFVYASPGGIAAALWIAAGTKVAVILAWCLWKKKIITETIVTSDKAVTGPT